MLLVSVTQLAITCIPMRYFQDTLVEQSEARGLDKEGNKQTLIDQLMSSYEEVQTCSPNNQLCSSMAGSQVHAASVL